MVAASGHRNVLPHARIRELHAAEVRSVVVVSWREHWIAGAFSARAGRHDREARTPLIPLQVGLPQRQRIVSEQRP